MVAVAYLRRYEEDNAIAAFQRQIQMPSSINIPINGGSALLFNFAFG